MTRAGAAAAAAHLGCACADARAGGLEQLPTELDQSSCASEPPRARRGREVRSLPTGGRALVSPASPPASPPPRSPARWQTRERERAEEMRSRSCEMRSSFFSGFREAARETVKILLYPSDLFRNQFRVHRLFGSGPQLRFLLSGSSYF
jgi:hypothetical protein